MGCFENWKNENSNNFKSLRNWEILQCHAQNELISNLMPGTGLKIVVTGACLPCCSISSSFQNCLKTSGQRGYELLEFWCWNLVHFLPDARCSPSWIFSKFLAFFSPLLPPCQIVLYKIFWYIYIMQVNTNENTFNENIYNCDFRLLNSLYLHW